MRNSVAALLTKFACPKKSWSANFSKNLAKITQISMLRKQMTTKTARIVRVASPPASIFADRLRPGGWHGYHLIHTVTLRPTRHQVGCFFGSAASGERILQRKLVQPTHVVQHDSPHVDKTFFFVFSSLSVWVTVNICWSSNGDFCVEHHTKVFHLSVSVCG